MLAYAQGAGASSGGPENVDRIVRMDPLAHVTDEEANAMTSAIMPLAALVALQGMLWERVLSAWRLFRSVLSLQMIATSAAAEDTAATL